MLREIALCLGLLCLGVSTLFHVGPDISQSAVSIWSAPGTFYAALTGLGFPALFAGFGTALLMLIGLGGGAVLTITQPFVGLWMATQQPELALWFLAPGIGGCSALALAVGAVIYLSIWCLRHSQTEEVMRIRKRRRRELYWEAKARLIRLR